MKTATLPAVRVTPELRQLAESVLKEGESLSTFVEDSVRKQAQMREEDRAFYARGMRASAMVKAGTMRTYTAAESLARLRAVLERKKAEKTEKAALAAKSRQPKAKLARAATMA
jgi:hypothetical protein